MSAIYGIYSFTLPASPPEGKGQSVSIIKILGFDALKLMKNPSYLVDILDLNTTVRKEHMEEALCILPTC